MSGSGLWSAGAHPLILASSSPRRKELLDQMGVPCIVRPATIDESIVVDGDPTRLAIRLSAMKATWVRDDSAEGDHQSWILGADTVVAVGSEILGKPADVDHAAYMMRLLSGQTHVVITGVALVIPNVPDPICAHTETEVSFSSITAAELDQYLKSEEWSGVAGAYRIQGLSARFVERISGSYSNVVGLPIHLLYSILKEHNYPFVG